jgi:hypothetical protein
MEPHSEGLTQQDKLQAIIAVSTSKVQLVKLNCPIRDRVLGFRWVMMVKMLCKGVMGVAAATAILVVSTLDKRKIDTRPTLARVI